MTDDLVKRLRDPDNAYDADAVDLHFDAADRIEQLEAALRNARARYVELDDKEAAEAMAKIISEALGDDCD